MRTEHNAKTDSGRFASTGELSEHMRQSARAVREAGETECAELLEKYADEIIRMDGDRSEFLNAVAEALAGVRDRLDVADATVGALAKIVKDAQSGEFSRKDTADMVKFIEEIGKYKPKAQEKA